MSQAEASSSARVRSGQSLIQKPASKVPQPQNGSVRPLLAATASSNELKCKNGLLSIDPDDLLARHTVYEIKSILHKLRSDIDAKQEELRLMVGERYRDLIEASTSIISMSHSSKRVIDTVDRMKHTASSDFSTRKVFDGSRRRSNIEDSQLKILQCLAAQLKLLIDVPEHLWRLLERKQCLHAAWLFLLSRVVYRSLIDEESNEAQDWIRQGIHVKEQFPLVQRQWESVSQFRAQISHKATLFLREQDLRSQDLCSSVLALHFLDSSPLADALDVFLKQRFRMLQHLYETINESDGPRSGVGTDCRSSKGVWNQFRSVLGVVIGTVQNARAVFQQRADGSPSMITQVLLFMQTALPQSNSSLPPELCLSSQAVLSSLPNSNHLLALPSDITTYKPFIDLDSPSSSVKTDVLSLKLRMWLSKALEHLHASAGSWISHLHTAKLVWEVHSLAAQCISEATPLLDSSEKDALHVLIDDVCKIRVQDVWKNALREISSAFDSSLQAHALEVSGGREDSQSDTYPVEFLLSAPQSPSVMQASLNVPLVQSSFQKFRDCIRQRLESDTPLIMKIMSNTEGAASSLRDDLDVVFVDEKNESLQTSYILDSEKAAGDLFVSIEKFFEEESANTEHSIRRLYFLGRLAHKLSLSPLLSHLRSTVSFSDRCNVRARRIYDSCVERCASAVIQAAQDKIINNSISRSHHLHEKPSIPSSASPQMIDSLLSLAESVEKFGHFKDDAQRSQLAQLVLSHFASSVADSSRQANRDDLRQFWDLYFLRAICADWGQSLSGSVTLLDRSIADASQVLPSHVKERCPDIEAQMRESVNRTISHVRLLLSALLAPLEGSPTTKSPKNPGRNLGQQKTAPTGDALGVMNLAKPSARFGLLWVAGAGS